MFQNRKEAGELLAEELKDYKNSKDAVVVAIPRGGVVVGYALSSKLNLPLDIVVVKKLGAPGNPELAIGAIAQDGTKVIDAELSLRLGVEQEYLDKEIERKKKEIEEKIKKFRPTTYNQQLITILTDDGVATGATCEVAIKHLKQLLVVDDKSIVDNKNKKNNRQPTTDNRQLILAMPVIAKDTYKRLKGQVDDVVALEIPEMFGAVGQFYREFGQVSDETVIKILRN